MTNEDKIKAMNKYELADILPCSCCVHHLDHRPFCMDPNKCQEGILKWLGQEVTE